jgi:DedD protein
MANPDASSEIPVDLKKRARRRLVGAIALALLAIIVLPMVMDHEPKPANQDIQIRIPSQEAENPVPHAPTGQVAVPSTTLTVTPAPSPGATPANADEKPPVDLKAELKPSAESTQQTVAKTAAVSGATQPVDKLAPEKSESAHPADEAHALAALSGIGDQWLVRLGAYQNAGNVKQLLVKVKEAGIPAYAEKFDSPKGPRTRVLAGPFGSREAAEKAQARIKKIGVDGTVIAKQ